MNWKPSGTGFEPKKVALLGGLLLVLVYFLWPSSHTDEGATPVRRPPAAVPAEAPYAAAGPPVETRSATARRANDRGTRARQDQMEEFRPSLRKVRLANTDPSRVDPTLRLDLLARLQTVKMGDNMRSLFEAGEAPQEKINEPPPVHPGKLGKPGTQVAVNQPPPPPPGPPPPPPIPLKYYGFVNPANAKDRRAFFLDGDDIIVGAEGDTVQKRYKIVRIGQNSAVVEDTQFSDQQTLPIVAEAMQQAG